MTTYPLIHVTLLASDEETGQPVRDTIAVVAGVLASEIPSVLMWAAENVARRVCGADPEADCPLMVRNAIRARLDWYVEGHVVCGAALVSATAKAIADALIETYRDELAADTRSAA